ncbi:hypothetical protein TNCV_4195681 [Trichonephila clavipes]|nr:hypothetical protein TNCV_4195681 [Trichonephila clavipes]
MTQLGSRPGPCFQLGSQGCSSRVVKVSDPDMYVMSPSTVPQKTRRWCKRFSVGRESTEDDQRPGRLVTVSGVETVTKINQIVRADRRMSIRMIMEAVKADKETVR